MSLFLSTFAFKLLSCVWLFVTPCVAAGQAPLSGTIYWSLLKFMPTELVFYLTISSSATPFSCFLQSFPSAGSFPMSWLFTSGRQSIGASALVLPMNIQSWFPLGLTSLISLQSKCFSRVFYSITIWKLQYFSSGFFTVQLSHPHITTGKNITLYTYINVNFDNSLSCCSKITWRF